MHNNAHSAGPKAPPPTPSRRAHLAKERAFGGHCKKEEMQCVNYEGIDGQRGDGL